MKSYGNKDKISNERICNLDVMKLICSLFVVCIHAPFPGIWGGYITAITRTGVPVFFMITGYFFKCTCSKLYGERIQLTKILKLFLVANVFYAVFNFMIKIPNHGVSGAIQYIVECLTCKKLIAFLCFNESPFSGHLWYLGALLYVLLIIAILRKVKLLDKALFVIPVLLIVDLVFGKYSLLIWGKEFDYIYVRNFLFVGLPYFLIGYTMNKKSNWIKERISPRLSAVLTCTFVVTTILERFLLEINGINATRDHYISTTFLSCALFIMCLVMKDVGKNNWLAVQGRQNSTMVYILHPAFITVLSVLIPTSLMNAYNLARPIIIFSLALTFAMIHSWLVDRIKK